MGKTLFKLFPNKLLFSLSETPPAGAGGHLLATSEKRA